MSRLALMLLRAARYSSSSRPAAAAGGGLVRGSCPIAAFLPRRGLAGEASSDEDDAAPGRLADDSVDGDNSMSGTDKLPMASPPDLDWEHFLFSPI